MSRSGHFRRRRRGPRADATGWYGGVTWFGPAAADDPDVRRFEIGDGNPARRRSRALVAEVRDDGSEWTVGLVLHRPSIPQRAFVLLARWLTIAQSERSGLAARAAEVTEIRPFGGRRRLLVSGVQGQRLDELTVTLDTGHWPEWSVGLNPRTVTMGTQHWTAVADWVSGAIAAAAESRLRERAAKGATAIAAHYGQRGVAMTNQNNNTTSDRPDLRAGRRAGDGGVEAGP